MLGLQLKKEYKGRYRKVWVNTTRLGTICITMFPVNGGDYQIITQKKFGELTFEKIKTLIDSKIT